MTLTPQQQSAFLRGMQGEAKPQPRNVVAIKGGVPVKEIEANALEAYEKLLGAPAQRRQRQWLFLCPLHGDRKPSFSVNPESGEWYCHPCGKGGGIFKLGMLLWGATWRDTGKKLAGILGLAETAVDTADLETARAARSLESDLEAWWKKRCLWFVKEAHALEKKSHDYLAIATKLKLPMTDSIYEKAEKAWMAAQMLDQRWQRLEGARTFQERRIAFQDDPGPEDDHVRKLAAALAAAERTA